MSERHQSQLPPCENKFHVGNGGNGKHYWLTPPDEDEMSDCKRCDGRGFLSAYGSATAPDSEPCDECGGSGRMAYRHVTKAMIERIAAIKARQKAAWQNALAGRRCTHCTQQPATTIDEYSDPVCLKCKTEDK
jgi:hypothetical protein